MFTYDRFLFIMTFRNFDVSDCQLAFDILNMIFVLGIDFQTKFNDFLNVILTNFW